MRHGPHQEAQKSTITGRVALSTTSSKVSSVTALTSAIGRWSFLPYGVDRRGVDRRGPNRRGVDRRGPNRRGVDRRGPNRRQGAAGDRLEQPPRLEDSRIGDAV